MSHHQSDVALFEDSDPWCQEDTERAEAVKARRAAHIAAEAARAASAGLTVAALRVRDQVEADQIEADRRSATLSETCLVSLAEMCAHAEEDEEYDELSSRLVALGAVQLPRGRGWDVGSHTCLRCAR